MGDGDGAQVLKSHEDGSILHEAAKTELVVMHILYVLRVPHEPQRMHVEEPPNPHRIDDC